MAEKLFPWARENLMLFILRATRRTMSRILMSKIAWHSQATPPESASRMARILCRQHRHRILILWYGRSLSTRSSTVETFRHTLRLCGKSREAYRRFSRAPASVGGYYGESFAIKLGR